MKKTLARGMKKNPEKIRNTDLVQPLGHSPKISCLMKCCLTILRCSLIANLLEQNLVALTDWLLDQSNGLIVLTQFSGM